MAEIWEYTYKVKLLYSVPQIKIHKRLKILFSYKIIRDACVYLYHIIPHTIRPYCTRSILRDEEIVIER